MSFNFSSSFLLKVYSKVIGSIVTEVSLDKISQLPSLSIETKSDSTGLKVPVRVTPSTSFKVSFPLSPFLPSILLLSKVNRK